MKTNYVGIIIGIVGAVVRAFLVILVIYGIYRGALIAYDYGYRVFAEEPISSGQGRTVSVTIVDDMSASEMGAYFVDKGLIRDKNLFIIQYNLSEYKKDILPGVYDLSTAMTAEEMLKVLAGKAEPEEETD